MQEYTVRLTKRERVARDTLAFHFQKPEGFSYTGGQNGDFTLINPPQTDAEGDMRSFTFASAPFEPQIMIASRMRDTAFKRVLGSASLGLEVKLVGPMGNFILPKDPQNPVAFITGGIGVTPARSIIAQACHDKLPHRIFLFSANRHPEDAAFLNELTELARQNANFSFIPVMTQAGPREWLGEAGHINKELLKRYLWEMEKPIYYLSGPPGLVKDMSELLLQLEVGPGKIKTEEFTGY